MKTKRPVRVTLDRRVIGARIKAARELRKWSRSELGRIIGRSGGIVSCWEAGLRLPNRNSLVALCKALRRSLDFVLFGSTRNDRWYRRD